DNLERSAKKVKEGDQLMTEGSTQGSLSLTRSYKASVLGDTSARRVDGRSGMVVISDDEEGGDGVEEDEEDSIRVEEV
ncbi:hypothetical protein A2U01_0098211, partial [Trifolium medium]|nr:hypothetical protein [Trifolium medium]